MSFFASIRVVMLRKYASFSGRAGRSEFWSFTLLVGVLVLALLAASAGTAAPAAVLALVLIALLLCLGLPATAVTTRRLHDIGMSGRWQLVALIPVLGPGALLVIAAQPGEPHPNRFGPALGNSLGSHPCRAPWRESLLRRATTLLAAWGVLAALCVLGSMLVLDLAAGSDVWGVPSAALAGWIAAPSGLWPDPDMAAGLLAPVSGLMLGALGLLLLTRYRTTDPPRVLSATALGAGLLSLTATVGLAVSYGGMGLVTVVEYSAFPLGFMLDGYAAEEAVNALWQVGASMTLAWIVAFAVQTARPASHGDLGAAEGAVAVGSRELAEQR